MLDFAQLSKEGSRNGNEDCVGVSCKDGLYGFFLADGLGGMGKGDLASSLAVETVQSLFEKCGALEEDFVRQCFETAQEMIQNRQEELGCTHQMKTTMVVLVTDGRQAVWGHAGDSRLYRFGKDHTYWHTADHSVPQMLVALGEIEEKDIRGHADRSRILKALGVEWSGAGYQISQVTELGEDEGLLLCTDGWWESILEEEMTEALGRSETAGEWLEEMETVLLGKKTEGQDNYSAIGIVRR